MTKVPNTQPDMSVMRLLSNNNNNVNQYSQENFKLRLGSAA